MSTPIYSDFDFLNVSKINNLPAATESGQPIVYEQFNAAIEGLNWKDSVKVSTQGNIDLSSPGASIDSISLSNGDRVLVRNQNDPSENGIYVWNGASSAMTRSADASTGAELVQAVVVVDRGTDEGTSFRQTQVSIALGSSDVLFTGFVSSASSASESTSGIVELATQVEVDTGTDAGRVVTPATLAGWSGRLRKYTSTIGDNSATQFDVSHNFNTDDVTVEIYDASSKATVVCDVKRQSANAVRLNFTSAPPTNGMKVVIIG